MHPELSSARLYIAQRRSAAQSCAVSCGAVRSFEHTAAVISSSCSTRYGTNTRFMYVFFVYSSLCFLQLIVLSRSPPTPPPANIARTAVQNVASTSTRHSAGQLALRKHLLVLLSIPYSHQIVTGLFFLLHLFTCFS